MPSRNEGGSGSGGGDSQRENANQAGNNDNSNRWNRRTGRRNDTNNRTRYPRSRFEGREPTLKGHIYEITSSGERSPEQYIKTTEEIETYVGRTYKDYTSDFVQAIQILTLADPVAPANPANNANLAAIETWKLDLREHRKKRDAYDNFKAGLYSLVFGQCSDALQDRLKSHVNFNNANQNGIALLTIIKTIMYTFEERQKMSDALDEVKVKFFRFKQGNNMPLQQYHDQFIAMVKVLDEVGVTMADQGLIDHIATANGRPGAPNEADRATARQQALTVRFVKGTNHRHAMYRQHLRNSYLDGPDHDNYPTSITAAYNIISRREGDGTQQGLNQRDGVSFATQGEEGNGNGSGNDNRGGGPTCYSCGEVGHIARYCPRRNDRQRQGTANVTDGDNGNAGANDNAAGNNEEDAQGGQQQAAQGGQQQGANMFMVGFSFSQQEPREVIPSTWILLDNQSTVDVFKNGELLNNIRAAPNDESMTIRCNAGSRVTRMVGDLAGYGEVWYDPDGIANILSLSNILATSRVVFDSDNGNVFTVTRPNGHVRRFSQSQTGLFYLDASDDDEETSETEGNVVLVNTVASKRTNYTQQDYLKAKKAREIQKIIGRPSTREFMRIISSNELPNCTVTVEDIRAAEDIFGPDIGALKGKTTRRNPHRVEAGRVSIPFQLLGRYRDITLCVDIMFVNKIPFLISMSRSIRFGTVEALPNRKHSTIMSGVKDILKVYRSGGFRVRTALMDGEFAGMRGDLADLQVTLNVTGRDEHVGDIERFIRTVKERMRSIYNTLPFKMIPTRIVIEMASACMFWLNAFPNQLGISTTLSPRTLVTGLTIDFRRHCRYEFGEYVQTHEPHDNGMGSRTVGAIAMGPTGNEQGNFYFFSLSTGRRLNRSHATKVPMPDDVIATVERLARRQRANPGLVFLDRNRDAMEEEVDDDDDDDSYHPGDDSDEEGNDDHYLDMPELEQPNDENGSDDDETYNPDESSDSDDDDSDDEGDMPDLVARREYDSSDSEDEDDDAPTNADNVDNVAEDVETVTAEEAEAILPDQVESAGVAPEADDTALDAAETSDTGGDRAQEEIDQHMDEVYGERSGEVNLRARKPRDYSHRYGHALATLLEREGTLATPQMSMRKGLKVFGQDGVDAVKKEMQQLHDRKVMAARKPVDLTPEQRKEALAYLMFLKRKRCGKVKGRGCADGRKQRQYVSKEDSMSPTVSTEAVFLTALVDAQEGRHVATVDVPGAFMQADMDELVHVKLEGKMAELLLEIDPVMYSPYMTKERGTTVLYVELLKALYGTVRAARLFWEKLSAQLQEWGFEPNPYDSCVVNKMINGKQCTVVWHVDDLKISHVDKKVVDNFISMMECEFGKETPLSINHGTVHDYLGMILDFSTKGKLRVDMVSYLMDVLENAPDEMRGASVTPATNFLFDVREDSPLLDKDKGETFHHITMQLLYLSQRGRPDIRPAISFLCGRVQKPNEDDYAKLTRVMKYLDCTKDLVLTISADGSHNMYWWVDASFAVHPDMKSHTGGMLSLGAGCVYATSVRQKLVGRSSTEAELIGVHDVLPQILWTRHFMMSQGWPVGNTYLYQDNTSAMLLEKNGRASSTKRTRHIKLRYFYVKDRIDSKDIILEHCPTKVMWGDYFTKPLQGDLFRKMRDKVMNIDPTNPYHSSHHRSVLRKPGAHETDEDRPRELKTMDKDPVVRVEPDPKNMDMGATLTTAGSRRSTASRTYADIVVG